MSMILDALSRAEKERKESTEGEVGLSRYTNAATVKDDKVKRWILIALIINISFLSLFVVFYFWKSDLRNNTSADSRQSPTPVVVQTEDKQSKSNATPKPVEKIVEPVVAKTIVTQQSSLQEEAKIQRKRKISKEEAIGVTANKSKAKVTIAAEPLSVERKSIPIPIPQAAPSNSNKYLSIKDLPAAEKSKIRSYEVNVHVYDDVVEERFVLVNMKKYKQGDRLPGGGPVVSEITPEGLVVEFAQGEVLLERN